MQSPTKSPAKDELYHASHHVHVARPYDKHSKLYHPEQWNYHDIYNTQVSYEGSIVTRSQTAFNRINNDESDMVLFGNQAHHHPPDLPHLMITMKDGTYGAVPRTIVTRSMANHLDVNPTLTKTLEAYKAFHKRGSYIPESKSFLEQKFKQESDAVDKKVEIKIDEPNNEDKNSNPPNPPDSIKASSPFDLSTMYDKLPNFWANPAFMGESLNRLKGSTFSEEARKIMSQSKETSLPGGRSKILKDPSFQIKQNYVASTTGTSQEVVGKEKQAPLLPLATGGAGGIQKLSPISQDYVQCRM